MSEPTRRVARLLELENKLQAKRFELLSAEIALLNQLVDQFHASFVHESKKIMEAVREPTAEDRG